MNAATYDVTVNREGKWWMVHIPAVNGLTQARKLSEAALMAREYVSVSLDIPIESVNAVVTEVDGLPVRSIVEAALQERIEAARLEAEATAKVTTIAKALAERDVPMRDIGAVLGISHQRVHQLIAA